MTRRLRLRLWLILAMMLLLSLCALSIWLLRWGAPDNQWVQWLAPNVAADTGLGFLTLGVITLLLDRDQRRKQRDEAFPMLRLLGTQLSVSMFFITKELVALQGLDESADSLQGIATRAQEKVAGFRFDAQAPNGRSWGESMASMAEMVDTLLERLPPLSTDFVPPRLLAALAQLRGSLYLIVASQRMLQAARLTPESEPSPEFLLSAVVQGWQMLCISVVELAASAQEAKIDLPFQDIWPRALQERQRQLAARGGLQ